MSLSSGGGFFFFFCLGMVKIFFVFVCVMNIVFYVYHICAVGGSDLVFRFGCRTRQYTVCLLFRKQRVACIELSR